MLSRVVGACEIAALKTARLLLTAPYTSHRAYHCTRCQQELNPGYRLAKYPSTTVGQPKSERAKLEKTIHSTVVEFDVGTAGNGATL